MVGEPYLYVNLVDGSRHLVIGTIKSYVNEALIDIDRGLAVNKKYTEFKGNSAIVNGNLIFKVSRRKYSKLYCQLQFQ